MFKKNGVHLPQIEWFYDENVLGGIYPFIGKADLKTLIRWRTDKINSDRFMSYNKDARYMYLAHIQCMEECIRILLSNPTPEFALYELEKIRKRKESEEKEKQARADEFFDKLTDEGKAEFLKLQKKLKLQKSFGL
jgi:hypothetical protein